MEPSGCVLWMRVLHVGQKVLSRTCFTMHDLQTARTTTSSVLSFCLVLVSECECECGRAGGMWLPAMWTLVCAGVL